MRKTHGYLGFKDIRHAIIGIPVLCFFIPQIFYQTYPWESGLHFAQKYMVSFIYAIIFWLIIRNALIALRKIYPKLPDTRRRLWLMFCFTLIIVPLVNIIFHPAICSITILGDLSLAEPSFYQSVLSTFSICLAIIALYEAIYFYSKLEKSITEKEAVKQAQIRSELQGLRNQVNPHFLFNSLNTLMNIVNEDQELAQGFLRKMSKVYRYVLESREMPLIPLKEELDFIEAYVFLQQERFKGNLMVNLNIDQLFHQHKIIPLCLQILFENAIKHNIISKQKPLKIDAFINDEMELVVCNNLQRKKQVLNSTKVGLENVSKRYDFFTQKEIRVIKTSDSFAVHIPLIHPNKSMPYESTDH